MRKSFRSILTGMVREANAACHEARALHTTALGIAEDIGDPHPLADAHDGLATVQHADGHVDLARKHWQEALALYTAVGAPCADQVGARLAELEQA